jgi:rhomboid protease GluP
MTVCSYCGRAFEASSDAETLCPQCAGGLAAPEPPAPQRSQQPTQQPTQQPSRLRAYLESPTIVLIALNVLVYLAMVSQGRTVGAFDSELLLNWGANSGALTSSGQWWRLFTSTFLHASFIHIALNMWCLFNLGWLAELLFGRTRYTLMYLLCGIGGSLGSICWRGNGLSVGASGAIFGIAGALIPAMMLHSNPRLRVALKRQLVSIALFVAYNLAFGAAVRGIDNAAHIGGLVTGLILGAIFPTGPEREEARGRMRVVAGCALMLVLFIAASGFASRHNQPAIEAEQAAEAYQKGDISAAIMHAERSVALKPDDAHSQFMLGAMLLTQHRYADAVEPLNATIRLRPSFGPAYVNLCEAQRQLKQLQSALANCEKGAQLASGDAESWFNLGRVRYELNDMTGARDALAKAVALNPEGFDENLQYGLMLIASGEVTRALPYLQKAHDLRPQDADVTRLLMHARSQ